MDNYIAFSIPSIWDQLHHVVSALTTGIHALLHLEKDEDEDSISLRKFLGRRAHGQLLRM